MVIQWGASRRSSVLDRPADSIPLSEGQSFTDQLVSVSIQEATNLKTAASLLGAGFAGRAARIGALSSLPSQGLWAPALRWSSHLPALAAESAAFAGLERAFHASPHPFQKDWARAAVTLASLKVFGSFSAGQPLVLNHLFTDLGLVGGHHAAHALGLLEKPEGSFSRQMLQAEATLWHLKGSLSVAHSLTPRLGALERSLDLALTGEKGFSPPWLPRTPLESRVAHAAPSSKILEGALHEHLIKMTPSDPLAPSSVTPKSRLSGEWKIEDLFEPSLLAVLPSKGFLKWGGLRMKIDAASGDIKIYESAFELLLFRADPSRKKIVEIRQYDQLQDEFSSPHEDTGRLPALLAELHGNRILSAQALKLLEISPEDIAAALPLQKNRKSLKAHIKAFNRNKPEELLPIGQYTGKSTKVTHQGSANFLDPQGTIDGLYTVALASCIALIALVRDPAGGALRNVGLAHLDTVPEQSLRQFFHHLRNGEPGKVDVYLLGDTLHQNQNLTLKIFRVLREENVNLRFVSVNRARRNVRSDDVLVDRTGKVYYGDREDLTALQSSEYGSYIEALREAGQALVFPDFEALPAQVSPSNSFESGSGLPNEKTLKRDLLDELDRRDRQDWEEWNRSRRKKPSEK